VKFAREGYLFILIAAALAAAAMFAAWQRGSALLWALAAVVLLVAVWVAYFFRDPERTGERGERLVVAPADGKVVLITDVDEQAFMRGRASRVSIFMNVFSVHVNRYPVSGTVGYVKYSQGKFLNAVSVESSDENEQMSVGVDTGRHKVLVRQIAGLIARRIITYSREGERVQQGDRMGLIRFGSRVDVYLPHGAAVKVRLGELTSAGTTVLAELPEA
jgi:phosphatidylserine decarboxylase